MDEIKKNQENNINNQNDNNCKKSNEENGLETELNEKVSLVFKNPKETKYNQVRIAGQMILSVIVILGVLFARKRNWL